jgi:3-phosphoshikimate 1-carboxyvinyltransferase
MRVEPARRLSGRLRPPADKSISHRAALLAAMSGGRTRVLNYLDAADTAATLAAVGKLGAAVTHDGPSELLIEGAGLRGARAVEGAIDVRNAGTLLRMLPGWLAGQPAGRWTIDGDESIRRRPVDRVVAPLRQMGARIECREGRLPPLRVSASPLHGIRYELPVASAQVKSCVLLAGLLAEGDTTVVEPLVTRDHTERMLAEAGVPVLVERAGPGEPLHVTTSAVDALELGHVEVPGDFSSAAFFAVAATLVPRSEVVLEGVGVNPTRTGLLAVMQRMGAQVEVVDERMLGGEPVGDLVVRHAQLEGTRVEASEVPLLIDELPLVALLGTLAAGTTVVTGAEELRHKESDRIATVVEGLGALGARIEATPDGFAVEGAEVLEGGAIESHGDHRLAMLGAVAGLASRLGADIGGFDAAAVSYPAFLRDLERVAA